MKLLCRLFKLTQINAIDNVGLVVIDTLHRNMGSGDENSSKDFAEFLNNIDSYIKSTGATVIIIHHSGHDATERARGSSSIRAALDVEYKIDKDDGNLLTLTNTKMKNHEPPKPMSFKFKQIQISESESSVILELTEFVAKSKSKSLSNNSLKTLQSLSNVIGTNGTNPPEIICDLFKDSPQNIPKTVVTIEQWRAAAYMAIVVDSDTDKKQNALKIAFQRCRSDLEKGGFIGMHGDYAWKIDRTK